jgi:probable phosphoglycerate mutase
MGHLDSPLTELGQWQADALARRLGRVTFDALYSSDLGRALATSRCISATSQRQIIVRPELREWNKGIFQGLTRDEAESRLPQETGALDRMGDDYESRRREREGVPVPL